MYKKKKKKNRIEVLRSQNIQLKSILVDVESSTICTICTHTDGRTHKLTNSPSVQPIKWDESITTNKPTDWPGDDSPKVQKKSYDSKIDFLHVPITEANPDDVQESYPILSTSSPGQLSAPTLELKIGPEEVVLSAAISFSPAMVSRVFLSGRKHLQWLIPQQTVFVAMAFRSFCQR